MVVSLPLFKFISVENVNKMVLCVGSTLSLCVCVCLHWNQNVTHFYCLNVFLPFLVWVVKI